MQTPIGGREVATLYNELRDCLRAKNHEQAKRVYRELVRAGHPLSEILGEATNILDTVKQFEPLDASLRQSPLRKLHIGGDLAMLRIPKTYLGLALAVVIAVMSVGLFLLMGHTEGKIPMTSPAGGTFIAPEGLTSTGATTGGELTAATVAPSSTTEPSSASTDADLTPAPGAPLIGATATGPDRPPVVGLDAK